MPSCCIYEVLDGILFLNRIYANVNEFHISETFLKCSEYVTIGAKLCVFHVLLCSVTICLKYKKKKNLKCWIFFPNIISIWSEANVMIDSEIPSFFQHYKIQFVNVIS